MAQADWENGNRESRPSMTGNGEGRRLREQASETKANATAFAHSLGATAKEVDGMVRELAARSPYAVLAGALGVGFILGGGIPPALMRGVVGFAGRYALAAILSSVVATEAANKDVQSP